jgi:hypothetical protein
MKLILAAVEEPLAKAWEERFCGELEFVSVHRGSILDVQCDAVVSPANSFGFMNGGIDLLQMHYVGADIQMRVRRQIFDQHAGELLVGAPDICRDGRRGNPEPDRGADHACADGAAGLGERLPCGARSISPGAARHVLQWHARESP